MARRSRYAEGEARWNILRGDVLDFCTGYDGPLFHAVLCDPPYNLGFMGKDWDRGGVAFRPETWAAISKLMLPGAFGMTFAGSRGWHRVACAIEDAGMLLHPTIFCWAFGSGFPKASRLDTQIDRAAGKTQQIIGNNPNRRPAHRKGGAGFDATIGKEPLAKMQLTQPATDLARALAGHRYGLQALKPAVEPIIVFQKPYEGKPVDSIVKHGAGALNIEAGRLVTTDEYNINTFDDGAKPFGGGAGHPYTSRKVGKKGRKGEASAKKRYKDRGGTDLAALPGPRGGDVDGRWPANFALQHHPKCRHLGTKRGVDAWQCVSDCPVRKLDEQAGLSTSGSRKAGVRKTYGYRGAKQGDGGSAVVGSMGEAARFFFIADWNAEIAEGVLEADPVYYCAKADSQERDAGLKVLPEKFWSEGRKKKADGPKQLGRKAKHNLHPTVKPIALCRWLASLLLPPQRYSPRRIFVPFAGVASEMIAAGLAGWDEIIGVEYEPEYVKIATARLNYWISKAKSRFLAKLRGDKPKAKRRKK